MVPKTSYYGDSGGGFDGAEDSVIYGESSSGDRGGRTNSYNPGRNKEVMVVEDVAITAKVFTAIAVVAAEAMVPKTAGNGSDSADDVFKATTVVAAVVITKDATRASMPNRR
ncbi:hypothetical protein Bbelb_021070 [Branchiostoma belcheri]|nr:hypothetical protein Bbelb_021070 [Branchiostoma belcheri]